MSSANPYFDEIRSKPEVIDPPQNDDMMDVSESANDSTRNGVKPNVAVSSSVRELLECPVCLNAMYPPIHQENSSEVSNFQQVLSASFVKEHVLMFDEESPFLHLSLKDFSSEAYVSSLIANNTPPILNQLSF